MHLARRGRAALRVVCRCATLRKRALPRQNSCSGCLDRSAIRHPRFGGYSEYIIRYPASRKSSHPFSIIPIVLLITLNILINSIFVHQIQNRVIEASRERLTQVKDTLERHFHELLRYSNSNDFVSDILYINPGEERVIAASGDHPLPYFQEVFDFADLSALEQTWVVLLQQFRRYAGPPVQSVL